MNIDKIFLLIWFFAEVLINAVLVMYGIAHLAHPNETDFGKSKFTRFLVWLGLSLVIIPFFLVHLDIRYHPEKGGGA